MAVRHSAPRALHSGSSGSCSPATGHAPGVNSPPSAERAAGSAWSPLRIAAFRALWLAQLGSMIGTWMQTVGAQWLLVDDPERRHAGRRSSRPPACCRCCSSPCPPGYSPTRSTAAASSSACSCSPSSPAWCSPGCPSPATAAGAAAHLHLPARLRRGRQMPPWQALIPDIVPRRRGAGGRGARRGEHEPGARRRAGAGRLPHHPVPGGVVFAINAASYAVMAVVLLRWGPRSRVSGDVPERFVPALRAGARYVRHSPGGAPAAAPLGAVRAAGHGAVGPAAAGRHASGWASDPAATAYSSPRSASARSPER